MIPHKRFSKSMHESMPLTWLSSGRNGRQRGCCRRRWRSRPRPTRWPSGRSRWRAPLPAWRCLCAKNEPDCQRAACGTWQNRPGIELSRQLLTLSGSRKLSACARPTGVPLPAASSDAGGGTLVVGHFKDGCRICGVNTRSWARSIWNGEAGLRVECGTCSMIIEVVKVGAARFGDLVVRLGGRCVILLGL